MPIVTDHSGQPFGVTVHATANPNAFVVPGFTFNTPGWSNSITPAAKLVSSTFPQPVEPANTGLSFPTDWDAVGLIGAVGSYTFPRGTFGTVIYAPGAPSHNWPYGSTIDGADITGGIQIGVSGFPVDTNVTINQCRVRGGQFTIAHRFGTGTVTVTNSEIIKGNTRCMQGDFGHYVVQHCYLHVSEWTSQDVHDATTITMRAGDALGSFGCSYLIEDSYIDGCIRHPTIDNHADTVQIRGNSKLAPDGSEQFVMRRCNFTAHTWRNAPGDAHALDALNACLYFEGFGIRGVRVENSYVAGGIWGVVRLGGITGTATFTNNIFQRSVAYTPQAFYTHASFNTAGTLVKSGNVWSDGTAIP